MTDKRLKQQFVHAFAGFSATMAALPQKAFAEGQDLGVTSYTKFLELVQNGNIERFLLKEYPNFSTFVNKSGDVGEVFLLNDPKLYEILEKANVDIVTY